MLINWAHLGHKTSLLAAIAVLFSCHSISSDTGPSGNVLSSCYGEGPWGASPSHAKALHKLAGPYAVAVVRAARKAHVSPKLVAAVAYVENGGNFVGSATRVSSAGAIGVMQLMPGTAWGFLHVDPWNVQQNIEGAAKYLSYLLHQFHGNQRLAVMAYNAGPSAIAHGYRPQAAVAYAQEVLHLADSV